MGGAGTAFADRTKTYVPTSVEFAELGGNLEDVNRDIKKPNRFVGIHASDGLALQQNINVAHLTFKTISIDERPSEYLTPLVQLHGDNQMDKMCQGSGRGLTQYAEDVRDRGENICDIGKYMEEHGFANW